MIPSQSEIHSTARKAARGVGLSWGIADEAGRACAWLWEHDLDGPSALASLLTAHETKACDAQSCPLHLGTRFCDEATDENIILKDVHSPILLLSFIAELAKIKKRAFALSFDNTKYFADPNAMYCLQTGAPKKADVFIQQAAAQGTKLNKVARRKVSPDSWDVLNEFAHRTYAPATEASRLAGAGAGLSDND